MNKEDWEVKKLENCFEFIRNGANIKQDSFAKGFPITRIETLSNDVFNRDRLGYANIFETEKYKKYLLYDKDILMSHINSMKYLGRAVLYIKKSHCCPIKIAKRSLKYLKFSSLQRFFESTDLNL